MSERDSLFDDRRRAEIRALVTRWISEPDDPILSSHFHTIPASPDDVFWLLDAIEAMRGLLIEADSAISHQHYRGTWPLDQYETDRLIAKLRAASQ